MQTPWDHRYAQRTQRMAGSAIRELLKLTERQDIISFAGGLPAPDVFPYKEISEACQRVMRDDGPIALQYGTTEGYNPLRELIAARTTRYANKVTIDNILITSGSQQALDLLGRIFINPGDRILVESPTYLGALQAWNAYGAEYVTVPSDEHGMTIDGFEEALRTGPKFIYLLPNFQNPTGVTLPLERRNRIIELADRYGVPIIEDDPYGQLRFEGENIPPVMCLDTAYRSQSEEPIYSGNVIYLSTFSKTLAPGLRLAWIIAPPEVIRKLVLAKQGADLHTSTFNQVLAYEIDRDGFIETHVKLIRQVYKERRDVMLDSLTEFMPQGVRWTRPEGGLFLWVTLPDHIDSTELLKIALDDKVAFVPGGSFHPDGCGKNTMRLNFSYSKPEVIAEGMARLGRAVKRMV
jgi:2-aminoadipate transaminase